MTDAIEDIDMGDYSVGGSGLNGVEGASEAMDAPGMALIDTRAPEPERDPEPLEERTAVAPPVHDSNSIFFGAGRRRM